MSDDNSEVISTTEATGIILPVKQAPWHYRELLLAFAISLVLQATFLTDLSRQGEVRIVFAGLFDLFILCRIFIARMMSEQGNGWIFYLVLTLSSPLWILGLELLFTNTL